jgi:prepilin-type N-terminal cleavage/methylation domain-containing protein
MINRSGFTLVELSCAVVIGAIFLTLVTPAIRQGRDVLAARAARDHLLQSLALARAVAPVHAGAEVVLDTAGARVRVQSGARIHEQLGLGERFGVSLVVQGSAQPTVSLRFDALGIGRLANRTIVLQRGTARVGVSLSMYGRARSW